MKPPRLRGAALTAARVAAESPGTSSVLSGVLKQSLGLDRLGALPASARGAVPVDTTPLRGRADARALPDQGLDEPKRSGWPRSSGEIAQALAQGKVDATTLTDRVLAALTALGDNRVLNVLAASDPKRSRFEAAESRVRHSEGRVKGALYGVPFLVKDELDVAGLPTRCGSLCEPDEPKAEDATIVSRLASRGAVFVGKTVMTEWGMSPLGQNPNFRMPHNAHHAERCPGGSSSGSAVAVALGIVPFAIGTDGGGSVRIPAALNGVFGIKPTFGRVSRATGGLGGTVGHAGPIASNAVDLARFLDAVASEHDAREALTRVAPPPPPGGFGARVGAGVTKLKVGVPEREWEDADPVVAEACRRALAALEKEGAELVPVRLPLASVSAPIGYLTIGCESFASQAHHFRERRHKMGEDLRLSFAILSGISASELIDAQRLRTALRTETARVMAEVDVLALPTTATAAPPLPVIDRGKAFADTAAIDAMCRFAFLGNLTGLPAGTAPVGVDGEGLPIGLQIMGDAWDEHVVIGVLAHLERIGVASVPKPKSAIDLLA
ncbi:MAG TPA: amidase [Polyangiaceae bacterium]|nr:amidase [Polyangiaceae bacterium]